MKKYVLEFVQRGLVVASGGPVVLAVIYGILGAVGEIDTLTPMEVCKGILTITILAFLAAGITMIYTVEQLPIASAILIHAGVLYLAYLIVYLFNNWLARNWTAFGVFTGIFVAGYAVIWVCIYFITKSKTDRINRALQNGAGN